MNRLNVSRNTRWQLVGLITAILTISVIAALALRRTNPKLPYHDSFQKNNAEEWVAYGGAWQLSGGIVSNRSDERGAKLVTGSSAWSDYRIQSDLEMLGHAGDIGLILRVNDEEIGTNSYNGYYIGLRSIDSAMVMGRADHGWLEAHPVPMPGGVEPSVWYRLDIVAVGCRIGAIATNLETHQSAWGVIEEKSCVASGKIGLRSMATGGAWKHISVVQATDANLRPILSHVSTIEHLRFPESEAAYYKMYRDDFRNTYVPVQAYQSSTSALIPDQSKQPAQTPVPLVSIESVRSMIADTGPIRVRGVVTLNHPTYIQDTTAGIELDSKSPLPLNLGDEVEASGHVILSGYHRHLEVTGMRLLWDRTLTVPLSISSIQAASGAFSSSLVEIRGYLRSVTRNTDGSLRLQLYDESQSFAAIVPTPLSSSAYRNWQPGSWLSVHGICVIGENSTKQSAAFTIHTRSSDDVEVLAGPPWWSGARLIHLLTAGSILIFIAVMLYLKIERWKMKGIMDERERLAQEMHDTLAQSFAGVGFHLQGVRNHVRNLSLVEKPDHLLEKLDTACKIVAQTHREASANIAALHPDADGGSDLLVALERYVASMLNAADLPIEVKRIGEVRETSLPVRDALFQVGREALTNVVRHSRSEQVFLTMRYEQNTVALEVRDNGAGFDIDSESGFGIFAMRRRCERIGAELCINSTLGKGTTVTITSSYGRNHSITAWLKHMWNQKIFSHRSSTQSQNKGINRPLH